MRRTGRTRSAVVLAVAAVSLPLALGACSKDEPAVNTSGGDAATTTTAGSINAGATVTITKSGTTYEMAPEPITVKVGQTVTWKNDSGTSHTIASDPGQAVEFDSDLLKADQTFVTTLATAGTYTYFCSIHSRDVMKGQIIVSA